MKDKEIVFDEQVCWKKADLSVLDEADCSDSQKDRRKRNFKQNIQLFEMQQLLIKHCHCKFIMEKRKNITERKIYETVTLQNFLPQFIVIKDKKYSIESFIQRYGDFEEINELKKSFKHHGNSKYIVFGNDGDSCLGYVLVRPLQPYDIPYRIKECNILRC